jgi:putative membrane-bound dehydrogenase-like protein
MDTDKGEMCGSTSARKLPRQGNHRVLNEMEPNFLRTFIRVHSVFHPWLPPIEFAMANRGAVRFNESPQRVMRKLFQICLVAVAAPLLCSTAAEFTIGAHRFTLPAEFEIELVAGTNLVPRPIEADFDEEGRLYVTDSSGSNDKIQKQLEDKPHRVLRLEDTDGDGRFDKSIVFADRMMFPEGAMWLDGSLYVAAPPSIWKLTDTNSDGVADVRVEWFKGETLTGCANDLHGPYAGPDGWIYWCKGAFAKQTYTLPNGKPFTTRASHIFRARPDGSGIEPVMTGGMDNPVGLAFTREGERIFSCTFFQHPEGGRRDGLIHAIYGGVYGKVHDVIDEHPRTGDLMSVLTHLGPAAPAGLMRYESRALGREFQDNLFTACFNLHKVTRHVLARSGSTYKTTDSDFLVSDNTDFHPTDVLEDADGSLVVIDTGGWYKLCCPTSQLHKPDVLGGIYRIRRKGAPKIADPRGRSLNWNQLSAIEATKLLDDARPVVVKRAIHALSKGSAASIPALRETLQQSRSETAQRNAIWALTQIESPQARETLHAALSLPITDSVALTALQAISAWRDSSSLAHLAKTDAAKLPDASVRRATAEVLGRIGSKEFAVSHLLKMAEAADLDRPLEHAIIYALLEIAEPAGTRAGLQSASPQTKRVALMALSEMPKGDLKPDEVTPLLSSTNTMLRQTASWIVERHRDWAPALRTYFARRLIDPPVGDDDNELVRQLAQSARDAGIQELLANALQGEDASATRSVPIALRAMARANLRETPAAWTRGLTALLAAPRTRSVLQEAIATARALPVAKTNAAELNAALIAIAERIEVPASLRVAAAASVSGGIRNLSEPLYNRLLSTLVTDNPVAERTDAANTLARARLSNSRLLELAAHMKRIGPMELPRVLPAFAQCTNEMVGLKLIDSLQASKSVQSLRAEVLKPAITNFPSSVHQRAEALLASINSDAGKQKAHIDELLAVAKNGDVRRGQALFNSAKTACSACHAIGYLGGKIGPDLTRIGQVRNERDLLEAIVYPSASFVRSYEPVIVTTKGSDEFSGVLKKDAADEVVLVTGPTTEQRIARADVTEMRPGTMSVMPSGLAEQLTKEELADLLAFLRATRW